MTACARCGREFKESAPRCPGCGERNPAAAGLFQTSSVLISAGGSDRVYRSVEDVPAALRHRLLKSTNGRNARTILITDRQGRRMIDKALGKFPGPNRKLHAVAAGKESPDPLAWLTRGRRKWIGAMLFPLALAVAAAAFLIRWK
ncbi:MAG: hypothetical protein ABSB88_09500 [Bryobacteraceae bacterium]|jgi:hypothetical protein